MTRKRVAGLNKGAIGTSADFDEPLQDFWLNNLSDALYTKFGEEDKKLAEEGIEDYSNSLTEEDIK